MTVSPSYGTNIAFIEELWEKYQHDPSSVSESWQEFFADYQPPAEQEFIDHLEQEMSPDGSGVGPGGSPAVASVPVRVPTGREEAAPSPPAEAREAEPPEREETPFTALRGVASKIVENMEASLSVPTATTVRNIPVKALEENRRTANDHLVLQGQPKISFTHVIGWAIVQALKEFPRMFSSYEERDGQPVRVDHEDINFGLAIDLEKKDGSRTLVVPNIKAVQKLNFAHFLRAYNDVIRRARRNELKIEDFQGTNVSLTNPGMIGTAASVPRLMPNQGTILATGQIDYPVEYSAADPSVLASLGISKVMTMTSTYDHRIIQGAESGAFLGRVHELLLGADNFYDEIFRALRVPYMPVHWTRDEHDYLSTSRGEASARQAGVLRMINAYRVRGHLIADLNPLEYTMAHHPELNPIYYGYTLWDLDREFICGGLCGRDRTTLRAILDTLRQTYCGRIGPEYMHIQDPNQKKWLQDRMEPTRNQWPLDGETKRRILRKLNDGEAFERFLHTKYVGHKRFSLEGSETLIPMLDHLFNIAADAGVEECVMGMAHRGRLNVLANVLGKSYEKIFSEFEGDIDPETTQGSGDVKYHLGSEGRHQAPSGQALTITLASNPSHLEAVDPVTEGMARARQKLVNDRTRSRILPLLIHGDAAFAGQGVVAELLNLSQLEGFRTGGTIHIVVNNQIGFTTAPENARSSVYATDIAKMIQAPIFHVNGDDPEACIRAVELLYAFRQHFKKDVVIDMFCYRRHGHNEADDPSMTQPRMYKLIKDHRSVRKLYTESLLRKEDIGPEEAEEWLDDFRSKMEVAFDRTREAERTKPSPKPLWTDEEETGVQNVPSPDTAVTNETLQEAGRALITLPEGFTLHPRLRQFIEKRRKMMTGEERIDWSMGEALAFGTLLQDGHRVRITGQDTARGTFSQRHAVLRDYNDGRVWIPVNVLATNYRAPGETEPEDGDSGSEPPVSLDIYDSLLSEYAVLGFEYGYSVIDTDALVCWEAQFGDFMNGAQIVIDQFISSAEEKWGQHSGLTLLLPHGYEGQGPEHSSARLERFLALCAEGNMQVVNATTPAQYFHVLRRQLRNDPRKPLVIMTPKFLLRFPLATSTIEEFTAGRFETVLDDPAIRREEIDSGSVKRVIVTSGKVFYDLKAAREENKRDDIAILRLEQFYPWPHAFLSEMIGRFTNAGEVLWVQEEPRNMGGWDFVDERLIEAIDGRPLRYVGRNFSASPATGSHRRHERQQMEIVRIAIEE
jgi:multifunctional 2-oxoglutarate metabolism enzyme